MYRIAELTLLAAGERIGSWTGSALPLHSVPCWPQRFLFWPQKKNVLGAAGLDVRLRGRLSAYVEQLLDGSYEVNPLHLLHAYTHCALASSTTLQQKNCTPGGWAYKLIAMTKSPGSHPRPQPLPPLWGVQVLMGVLRKELEPGLHISRAHSR